MSVFKRVFCLLCIMCLVCFSSVTAYAYSYSDTVTLYYDSEDGNTKCRMYTVDSANVKNKIILYDDGGDCLYVLRNTDSLDWCVKGLKGSWWTSSVSPVSMCDGWSGIPLTKGKDFGGITWGIEGLYAASMPYVNTAENPKIDFYSSIDDLQAGKSKDFFWNTPTFLTGQVGMIRGSLIQTIRQAVLIAVPCGVGLIALLIGLKKLKMLFLTFQH